MPCPASITPTAGDGKLLSSRNDTRGRAEENRRRRCRERSTGSDIPVKAPRTAHTKEQPMKYMMMMHTPSGGPFQIASWPQKDLRAHIAFMKDFVTKLRASGELVVAEGLAGPDQAKRVRAGGDGKPITDGVFPESKEFLAGYWIVDVDRAERAYELAAHASTAPGPGGKPLNLAIEVRQVMSGPPDDL
jgi:hypothetical protein